RDITENARALARRVELQRTLTYGDVEQPYDASLREKLRERQMAEVLSNEIKSDPTVQSLAFYKLIYQGQADLDQPQQALVKFLAIVTKPNSVLDPLTKEQVATLKSRGLMRIDDKNTQSQKFFVPWNRNGQIIGITYVELSNEALSADFWKKELPLFRQ